MWDSVVISFYLKRMALYHSMYYLIPCGMIGLMTIIVFILPVNMNERMTVGTCNKESNISCDHDSSTRLFFIRKSLFCLSLNFLNISRNWAWDFLKFFLTFTEINWLEWFTLSLVILYTWIWIPTSTFWMKSLNFGNWDSWFSYDFLKILTIWA